jgi:hypothetical protein
MPATAAIDNETLDHLLSVGALNGWPDRPIMKSFSESRPPQRDPAASSRDANVASRRDSHQNIIVAAGRAWFFRAPALTLGFGIEARTLETGGDKKNGGTMRTLFALVLLTLGLTCSAALADPNNDAQACTPDVFRLCSSAIPSRERIVTCLHENRRRLIPACYQVFNRKPYRFARPVHRETHQAQSVGWGRGSY